MQVAFGERYPLSQVYAPGTTDVMAFEPMTPPTNALITGSGLRWIFSQKPSMPCLVLRLQNQAKLALRIRVGRGGSGLASLAHEGATNLDSALGPRAVGSARPRVIINDAH